MSISVSFRAVTPTPRGPATPDPLAPLAPLADPVRRAVYDHVSGSPQPATRDATAQAVGISRSLAAYHLDKLVEEGLLVSGFASRHGGPGAGRPAKVYQRSPTEIAVAIPPRDDTVAAQLLATAVEAAGAKATAEAHAAARRLGQEVGAEARAATGKRARPAQLLGSLRTVLSARGYEPLDDVAGRVVLRNCPFDHLTDDHRDLVCGMNLALLEGVVEALRVPVSCALEPDPGRCCVTVATEG